MTLVARQVALSLRVRKPPTSTAGWCFYTGYGIEMDGVRYVGVGGTGRLERDVDVR